jgi:hypothetical protein
MTKGRLLGEAALYGTALIMVGLAIYGGMRLVGWLILRFVV